MVNQRWVFVVRALDRPGTLTAAAAVFSNRGISLEGILGSGFDPTTVEDGRLIFNFRATPEKQALLRRALGRLPSIFHIDTYAFEDERLRAIAVARLSLSAKLAHDDDGFYAETIAQTDTERLILLTGTPLAVEAAIAQFRQQDQLRDVVMSSITV